MTVRKLNDSPEEPEKEKDDFGELKGMIAFPCGCKAKVLIYEGSKGKFSTPCPICGKFALFYPEQMTAEVSGPARGASRKLNKGLSPSRLGP